MSHVIELAAIGKRYQMGEQSVDVLNGLNLFIDRNEFVALTGPSGSGKSTLMNILGCLDKPTAGSYLLSGEDVSSFDENRLAQVRNQRIGFIFQSFNLMPRMTALDNVAQPLIFSGVPLKERNKRALQALAHVELDDRADHIPAQLSGGQRQRVAIARALVTKPDILLADEPTGNLDSKTTNAIMKLFENLHSEGQTIVIVTHEHEIANRCKRIIDLRDGVIASDTKQGALS